MGYLPHELQFILFWVVIGLLVLLVLRVVLWALRRRQAKPSSVTPAPEEPRFRHISEIELPIGKPDDFDFYTSQRTPLSENIDQTYLSQITTVEQDHQASLPVVSSFNQKLTDLNIDLNKIIEDIPELTYIGDPILRTKATPVSLEEAIEVGNKLIEVLAKYRDLTGLGVGLAAPQIGSSANVFVTLKDGVPKLFINPQIIHSSEDKNMYKECCLSSGHLWCDVSRSKSITISYTDQSGEQVTEEYDSFWARLIQHEYDHLQGIVNVDRATAGTIDYRFGDPKEQTLRE